MIGKVEYVDKLPMTNLSDKFLVTTDAMKNLLADWTEFCDLFLVNFNKDIDSQLFS